MGFIIEDGKGNGYKAEVSDANKLLVAAVTSTQEHYANHNQGRGFSTSFDVTPTSAGDCFLYIKNTDSVRALSIEGFWFKMAASDYIDVKLNDVGTAVGGTDATIVNLNTASGHEADCIFQYGADITGLSGGQKSYRLYHTSSAESIYRDFTMDIILGANGVLSMYIGAGGTAVSCTIPFNFHGTNN